VTDTHVVSALKEKRITLASHIESLQGQIRQACIDLDHVEASLRLFDPDVDLAKLSPRKAAPVIADNHGEAGRVILNTLRESMRPLTTAQVNDAVMKARNLDTNDKALCNLMMKRTFANLKHWQRKRGLVRSMPGPGQQFLWELMR
jgi:hypothetical protein